MNSISELADFIKNGSDFAVISHVSPDGDTLGSAAALIYALKKIGKRGKWCCDGNIPADYMKIDAISGLVSENTSLNKFDSVIAVDVSSVDRLGNCAQLFTQASRKAVLDHHGTNEGFGQVNVVETRNANCFLVLELMDELGIELDRNIARALFVGISTDTGRLSHKGVTSQDVLDTARLYEYDINHNEIINILFQTSTMTKTLLRGRAIEHIRTAFDEKVIYTYLDTEDYSEFNADSADSEGVVEMLRSIDTAKICFFMRQIPEGYKVSMRCSADMNVADVCLHFGGGGHVLAAGCTLKTNREDAIMALLEKIGEVF